MKKFILLMDIMVLALGVSAQNVGIGTTSPNASALLHVDLGNSATKGLLVTGTYNIGSTVPDLGAGSRLMFYPGKVAFRVGSVSNTQWDNVNVGNYSVAMGRNTTASGPASTTMGLQTTASGQSSTAMGVQTTASGNNSTAMGLLTIASGIISTAMGLETTASGDYSTAMGNSTTASGNNSTAIGSYVSTNNVDGCLIIGDHSTTTVMNSGSVNGFRARFAGGYRFYTSSNLTTNAYLAAGDNAWSTSSSVHFKRELPGRSVCRHIILILWMKLIV